MMKMKLTAIVLAVVLPSWVQAAQIPLRIIETTDIHMNLTDFDYYRDKPDEKYGLTRTASLIQAARKEVPNSILVDNGDLIQGAPMGDYMAAKGLAKNEKHPAYVALEYLGVSASNLGNHEFNFGLDFLDRAIATARVPVINANVLDIRTNKPKYRPYVIKTMRVKDTQGKTRTIKVGMIGFVPPQIMLWDKKHLQNKVIVRDIVETAQKYVPEMTRKGADVIIAINHSELGNANAPYQKGQENTSYELSKIKGIDAVAFGHAHGTFPSKDFAKFTGINADQGTVNGVPATMPGQFGSHIGVIDLTLTQRNGKWQSTQGKSELRPIYDNANKKSLIENDAGLSAVMKPYHEATREFVGKPIGKASEDMFSYLALVQDDPTMQIVSMAQMDYVKKALKDDPKLNSLPVLSAVAPFKAGGRKNDPTAFTEVKKGELTFRNAADLYLYPNTLYALKVNGSELREWLECSAGMFNYIDVNKTQPQALLNWQGFRTYNFDVIDGVNYQIDVSVPARYDGSCKMVNRDSQRIQNLTYAGKPVADTDEFIIATNNYRATGGVFAGTGDKNVVLVAPDENRQVLANYIAEQSRANGAINPRADNNWSFAKITQPNVNVYFETANSEQARAFIQDKAVRPYTFERVDDTGFAVYRVDLSQ